MSTSPIPLHAAPAAGFEAPFEMLDACHRRVERLLGLLGRLAAHLADHGADAQAQQAAVDVMRYFDLAAPHHHEDEERHLLPRLRDAGHGALADRIAADHAAMSTAWQALRERLAAVAEGHRPADGLAGWRGFTALYEAHLAVEDGQAYPLARALVDAAGLAAMADEMAQRRGVRAPPGPVRGA